MNRKQRLFPAALVLAALFFWAWPAIAPAQENGDGIVDSPFEDLDDASSMYQDDADLGGEGPTEWLDADNQEYDYDQYDGGYDTDEPDQDDWFFDHYRSGRFLNRQPPGTRPQEQGSARSGPPTLRLSGKVLRSKTVELVDGGKQHVVAQVRSNRGRRRIVDLGQADRLKDLAIEPGARISVQGRPVLAGDRPILRADRIEASGQVVRQPYVRPRTFARPPQPESREAIRPSDPGWGRWH